MQKCKIKECKRQVQFPDSLSDGCNRRVKSAAPSDPERPSEL